MTEANKKERARIVPEIRWVVEFENKHPDTGEPQWVKVGRPANLFRAIEMVISDLAEYDLELTIGNGLVEIPIEARTVEELLELTNNLRKDKPE